METMNAKIENGELIVRIPVNDPPRPSKSGESLIVATSGGNQSTSLIVDGKPVTIGLNAYIGYSFLERWKDGNDENNEKCHD